MKTWFALKEFYYKNCAHVLEPVWEKFGVGEDEESQIPRLC